METQADAGSSQAPAQAAGATGGETLEWRQFSVCGSRFNLPSYYNVIRPIGQGAYGIVYKANGPAHGEVAVKVLNRSATGAKHAVSGLSGATAPHRFAWCLPGATPAPADPGAPPEQLGGCPWPQ